VFAIADVADVEGSADSSSVQTNFCKKNNKKKTGFEKGNNREIETKNCFKKSN